MKENVEMYELDDWGKMKNMEKRGMRMRIMEEV